MRCTFELAGLEERKLRFLTFFFSSDLDHSFDDDGDGKLVIAEHEDDLDIKETQII